MKIFERIAPIVYISYGKYNYKDRLMELGKALNKEQEAKKCLADFAAKIAEKKQAWLKVYRYSLMTFIFRTRLP
ncbi:hypothetical protein [Paenibacillus sp. NPDC055715]